MSDRDPSRPLNPPDAPDKHILGTDAKYAVGACRVIKTHDVLARPGDTVSVTMAHGGRLGVHEYRVEMDGKLRRKSGFRAKIPHGEAEGMTLPPLPLTDTDPRFGPNT